MAVFELEANGRMFEVEAPNMEAAIAALSGEQPAAPGKNVRPSEAPRAAPTTSSREPLGRLDPANEIEGVYVDAGGQQRVVNPATDIVGDDGFVYPRQTGQAGEIVNRGTILPFVETRTPDGGVRQGFGLPEFISGPAERANRLLTEPPQLGQGEAAAIDALIASTPAMGSVRATATREFQDLSRALSGQPRPGTIGPPSPPPGAAAFVGPTRPPPQPFQAPGDRAAVIAEELGVDLPRAAAGGRTAQILGGSVKELPWVGDPVVAAANRATQQLEARTQGVANQLGPSSREGAGLAARDAIEDWITSGSNAVNAAAYREVDQLINPSTAVPLSRTQQAVANLAARDIESASRDGQAAIRLVQEAINRPGMTYEGIKELRTRIGGRLSGDIDEHGVSNRALQQLYGALTEDLRFAVQRAGVGKKGSSGKAALAAFDEANATAEKIFRQRAALTKIIGAKADASGEAIVDRIRTMAGAARGGDIARINQAKAVIGQQAWDDVAGAILRNMGQTKDGWSLARWRTEYGNLSDSGKAALFGSGSSSHRATLDKIFELGKYGEQLSRIGNPSQSARFGALVAAPTAALAAPYATIATIFGGRILANALAKPITARATERAMKAAKDYADRQTLGREQLLVQTVRQLANALGEDEREAEKRLRSIIPGEKQ